MLNQTSFRLTTTLLPTDTTAKTTEVINKVDSSGNKFKPTFTEETVVLTNDDRTIMETTRATATDGVLTFVKRGLSDDNSATEVANRKLTWNPGTLAFITAGASDWIDIDDNLTWTGKQTYTGELVSENKATYKGQLVTEKGVKYPNFADVTALQAYADPFGGMFATVDSTGELYRYNAKTCCWDLVSTVDIGTYTIEVDDEAPAPGTANTIITFSPEMHQIYVGTDKVITNRYADVLLAGGGGGGNCLGGGGGGVYLGERVGLGDKTDFCISVGAGGASAGANGCPTSMAGIHTVTGGKGNATCRGGAGGTSGLNLKSYQGGTQPTYGSGYYLGYGGGGGACGNGTNGNCVNMYSCTVGGNGGEGVTSDITGSTQYYGRGGAGKTETHCGSGGTCGTTCCGCGVGGGANGAAGCGVAIIRYPTDGSYGISCATGGTVTCCCGYTIHTFTADGTFCIVS